MTELKDLTGKKFGSLTVVKFSHRKDKHYYWNCICDCGTECIIDGDRLRRGETKSCGCYKRNMLTTHGKRHHRLYSIWCGMKRRCYLPQLKYYHRYGGRGIVVCNEWKDNFQAFYDWSMNNGYKEGLSIDRIDNDGNYEPTNCRWVNQKTQARNTERNTLITFNDATHCLSEWAEILGFKPSTLYGRLHNGWTIEKAFTTPVIERN